MKFKSYQEVLKYLYENLPMFQRQGAAAFRKDLSKTLQLDNLLNHPHLSFKSVHIAGTNGKGSTAHMLSAIFQQQGYKTGLYTSPHLRDFTERIKVNGLPMDQQAVVGFVNKYYDAVQDIKPSFFEITLAMAFEYFKNEKVDVAVVETGMGGRLDSTNIITPVLSIITNVSYDHQQFLGETLPEIAKEKAGIIKPGVPVVISERQPEIEHVFVKKGKEEQSEVIFADDVIDLRRQNLFYNISEEGSKWEQSVELPLLGDYQEFNLKGVLASCKVINKQGDLKVSQKAIIEGLKNLKKLTGLKGRYQIVREKPRVICDVGHNEAGLRFLFNQLKNEKFNQLYVVLGVVNDKDLSKIWPILPRQAYYLFTQANIPRAMEAETLGLEAVKQGFIGEVVNNIPDSYQKALELADENDLIFVGGSTFTVAEINDLYNEE